MSWRPVQGGLNVLTVQMKKAAVESPVVSLAVTVTE
jgi:hypothetical protein